MVNMVNNNTIQMTSDSPHELPPLVILDVENLADFIWRFPLNHVCYFLARQIRQALDVQVICSEKEIKQSALVNLNKLSIPLLEIIVRDLLLVIASFNVLLAELDDLGQDFATHF